MTVRAPHFALVDLAFERVPGNRDVSESADIGAFVTQVIEIEQVNVRLAAIYAGVVGEVPAYPRSQFARMMIAANPGVRDLSLSITGVPVVRVRPLTQKADSLTRLPLHRAKGKLS